MVGRVAKINTYSRKLTLVDSLTKVYPLGMFKIISASLLVFLASCVPGLEIQGDICYEKDGYIICTDGKKVTGQKDGVKLNYDDKGLTFGVAPQSGKPQK